MDKKQIAYIVLFILAILIILIYLFHNNELFSNPIINLPANDVHFINDNNKSLIDVPIFNYKLSNLNNLNNLQPTQMQTQMQTQMPEPTYTQQFKTADSLTESFTDSQSIQYLSVFQHKPFNTYKGLGQYVMITNQPFEDIESAINKILDKKCLINLTSSPIKPYNYELIWTSDLNTDGQIFSVWHPIPPAGCIALGDVIVMGTEQPSLELVPCFPITMLEQATLSNGIIWKAINDMGKMCYCWGAGNIDCFRATNIYDANMDILQTVYNLPLQLLANNTLTSNNIQGNNSGNSINSMVNNGIQI